MPPKLLNPIRPEFFEASSSALLEPCAEPRASRRSSIRFSYRSEDVVPSPERICRTNGYPKTIRVAQGSEDMDLAYAKGGFKRSA
jgi:hypothetical protein